MKHLAIMASVLVVSAFITARLSYAPPPQVLAAECTTTVAAGTSIQSAIDAAAAGSTICVSAGTYAQELRITKDNLKLIGLNNPKIVPPPNASFHMIEIKGATGVELTGFTIDGLVNEKAADTKQLWLQNAKNAHVHHNTITNGGGECIRIIGNSTGNDISYNTIKGCGVYKYGLNGGKNGEGVYIGTDPEQIKGDPTKYKAYDIPCAGQVVNGIPCVDASSNNHIHHNDIDTSVPASVHNPQNAPARGNECVDVKEGAHHNTIDYNKCQGQQDPNSGGFDTRGSENTFAHNLVTGTIVGASLRIGAEPKVNYKWVAEKNNVYKNQFLAYQYEAALKVSNKGFDVAPHQSVVCGNEFSGTKFTNNEVEITMEGGAVNPACDGTKGTLSDTSAAGYGSACIGATCSTGGNPPPPPPPPPTTCSKKATGDANCDNLTDILDYAIWRAEYLGSCAQTSLNTTACQDDRDQDGSLMDADFDKNTRIQLLDFQVWAAASKG